MASRSRRYRCQEDHRLLIVVTSSLSDTMKDCCQERFNRLVGGLVGGMPALLDGGKLATRDHEDCYRE